MNQPANKPPRITKADYFFSKKIGEAIYAYNMIEDGDKILVAVSGGKDSMSLLKALRYKQGRLPVRYDIIACYVDLGFDAERPKVLEKYFREHNFSYTIEASGAWDREIKEVGETGCFWDAFNKHKILFETAERLGCNKVALGHHKDDIAETFLLNLFFHGKIGTMLPNQPIPKNGLSIIRPLCLCEKSSIICYAKSSGFPEFHAGCPNSQASKRMLMKDVLRTVSEYNKDVRTNIYRSIKKINFDYLIK